MNSPLQYLAKYWDHWLYNIQENLLVWDLMASKYTEKSYYHSKSNKTELTWTPIQRVLIMVNYIKIIGFLGFVHCLEF